MPSTTGSKQGELKCASPCCSTCCRVGWYQCCDGTSCFVALRRLYEFQNCVYEPKIAPLLIRADNVKLRIMQVSWGLHQGEEDKHHCLSQALTSLAAGNDIELILKHRLLHAHTNHDTCTLLPSDKMEPVPRSPPPPPLPFSPSLSVAMTICVKTAAWCLYE